MKWFPLVRWLALGGLALGMILRPALGTQPVAVRTIVDADVILVVDRTASMGATDHRGGTRAAGASADATAVVRMLHGAHFILITFDNTARIEVPATTDTATVIGALQALGWQENRTGTGSDIAVAVPLLTQTLSERQQRSPAGSRLVYYFGDGEQTAPTAPGSFAGVRSLATQVQVLGYGTPAGAPMRRSTSDATLVIRDGAPALSQASPDNLARIGAETGGTVLARSTDAASAALPRPELPSRVESTPRGVRRGELYPWFALAATGIVGMEIARTMRLWRRQKGGY